MKKRSIVTVAVLLVVFFLLPAAEAGAAVPIQTGEYIQMGESAFYSFDKLINGEPTYTPRRPILWVCLDADDPNGPLMMAMNQKAGSSGLRSRGSLWAGSELREALNQRYGEMFSKSEQRARRLVPQYTLLTEKDRELAEDPSAPVYELSEFITQCKPAESGPWLKQKLADVFFPLGIDQLKKAYEVLGEETLRGLGENFLNEMTYVFRQYQWSKETEYVLQLRVPSFVYENATLVSKGGNRIGEFWLYYPANKYQEEQSWIRPGYVARTATCFYLNQVTAQVRSGSGTKEDPYVVDTDCDFDDGKIIRIQGANLPYDTPVYEDQGETMVPLRAIIEALGGEISWDAATRTVQFNCRGVAARIEIGSAKVQVNGEDRWPAVAPQLRYDRTYVPFAYFENVFGLQQPWTCGWMEKGEENGQLLELLDAADQTW